MNFWEFLHKLGPGWPDARGWIGMSTVSLTVMVLWMMAERRELREDEFFQVIATAIILTGFVQGVVGWAYSATKNGGELADSNARIAEQAATTATGIAAVAARRKTDEPQPVIVKNPQSDPAIVEQAGGEHASQDEEDFAPRGTA